MLKLTNSKHVTFLCSIVFSLVVSILVPQFAFAENNISPVLISNFAGFGRHVVTNGNYAYALEGGDSTASLSIVNIENPASPVLVSKTNIASAGACQIQVVGNYVYLAAYHNGLKIIDVSNPASPTVVGGLPLGEHTLGVAIAGDYAYIANGWTPGGGGLKIINISNPASPTLIGSLPLTDYARAITVVGNYAYIGDTSGGMKIVNITNPAAPALAGSIKTAGPVAGCISVLGNYAYMDDDTDIRVINIANPASPILVGSLGIGKGNVLATAGYLYAALPSDGLKIFSITSPETPSLVASLTVGSGDSEIAIAGNYAYISDGGLKIIRIYNIEPVVSAILRSGTEDSTLIFTAADFTSHFTDSSGLSLEKIKISSLPGHGTLKLLGTAVTLNQEISFENLSNLVFVPDANWNGSTNFSWNGSNGTSYAATAANVNITIAAVTDVPTVSAITKSGTEDTTLSFVASDFIDHFSSPDSVSLTKIKIITLPDNGLLRLSGNNVVVGQEIPVENIGDLTFVPLASWYGTDNFIWNGSDGTSHATNPANVTVNIAFAPPVVNTITRTGYKNNAISFTASEFVNHFSVIDSCKCLQKVKIMRLPENGIIKLAGTNVNLNQEICTESLDNLTFRPIAKWFGTDYFTWNGSDGTSYAINPANVTMTLVDKCPPSEVKC